jgi:hypothetical protein
MRSIKGGSRPAAAASEAGLKASVLDTSLQAEALNVLPTAQPAVSVNAVPPHIPAKG